MKPRATTPRAMVQRGMRWLRLVLPNDRLVGAFLLCYLGVAGSHVLLLWYAGPALARPFLGYRDVLLVAAAAMYGVLRVGRSHPVWHSAYHRWLSLVPWTADKPLPLGPIHLVWQDLMVWGVLTAMMYDSVFSPWLLPLAMGLAYLPTLAVALFATNQPWHGYIVLYGVGFALLKLPEPYAVGLILASSYLVGYGGLLRSLRGFPWEYAQRATTAMNGAANRLGADVGIATSEEGDVATSDQLGWPYDQLSPKPPDKTIAYAHGFAISALAGWYVFVAATHLSWRIGGPAVGSILIMAGGIVLTLCMILRLGIYLPQCRSPISFWGRLATLRPIIPRYDQVYAAPLMMCVAGGVFLALGIRNHLSSPLAASLGVAAIMAIALNLGPSYPRWRLTGSHRIHPQMTGTMPRELTKL